MNCLERRRRAAAGFTLVELCVVILVMGILMVMGAAALLRARVAGHEANAIAAMRTINKAQLAYAADCGHGHFAPSLTVLGKPPRTGDQGYVAEDLAGADTVTRNGYILNVKTSTLGGDSEQDCHGGTSNTGYYASAVPTEPGSSGNRSFATNHFGGVWQRAGGTAPSEPFAIPSTLVQ